MGGPAHNGSVHPVVAELAAERKRQGIPLMTMSLTLGTEFSNVWRWETGRTNPTLKSLSAYANALGMRVTLEKVV